MGQKSNMTSRIKSLAIILAIVVAAAVLAYSALSGIQIVDRVIPIKEAIKLGLDLRGGISILLEASLKQVR